MKATRVFGAAAAAISLTLIAACGGANQSATSAGGSSDTSANGGATVTIGASSTPHGEILEYIRDNLAAKEGLNLKIVTYDDFVLPNVALSEKDLDANYFQHEPYLKAQEESKGYDFTALTAVHIEPYGIYSKKIKKVSDLGNDAQVGITDDPSNQSRALQLLAAQGLITLKDSDNNGSFTLYEVDGNSKNLKFIETAPEQLARSLADVDVAVINGNFALQAGLNPAKDAIVLESGANNPYANLLVARTADKDKPALVKLAKLITSPEVKAFIEKRWPNGEVIPAF